MEATATATVFKYLRLNGRQGRQDAAHEGSPGKGECGLHDESIDSRSNVYQPQRRQLKICSGRQRGIDQLDLRAQ